MIQVILVNDQLLFQEGMKAILEKTNECKVVATFDTTEEALQRMKADPIEADILILNLHLPDEGARRITKKVKKHQPEMGVISLVEELDEALIFPTLYAGCDGFLLTKHYSKKLIEAIKEVHRGEFVLSGPVARILVKRIKHLILNERELLAGELGRAGYYFTSRELDVLILLKDNYSNQEMAKELELSEGTVKNYVSEIYHKLNIRDRIHVREYLEGLTG